jgi:hypothetical protein
LWVCHLPSHLTADWTTDEIIMGIVIGTVSSIHIFIRGLTEHCFTHSTWDAYEHALCLRCLVR